MTFLSVIPQLNLIYTYSTVLSLKVKTRLRDAASWLRLAAGASSRSLFFAFLLSTVPEGDAGSRT